MQPYIEETLKFIGSVEMRDYLREHANQLSGGLCAQIVANAPAPMEQKIPALDLIAEQSRYTGEYYNPAKMAAEARRSLEERYDNSPGTVFLTMQIWRLDIIPEEIREEVRDWNIATSFDAAIRYLRNFEKDENCPDLADCVWYRIEKWVPGENGEMEEYCTWVLNYEGEIWYFDYSRKFEPEDWNDLWDYCGDSLSLPVPFQPGDIVLADCRPFASERRVLITEIGDNHDCCSLQCLFTLPDGTMRVLAFKHNSFLQNGEVSHISGLYRAVVWKGDLPKDEAPLGIISTALKANPQMGIELQEFIMLGHQWNITWEQVKEKFGL